MWPFTSILVPSSLYALLALLIILSIPRFVMTLCLSPGFAIYRCHSLSFSTWQTLTSPVMAQFSVAWLGLWKNCSEEKHFCRWLGMGNPSVSTYLGSVMEFSATRNWTMGQKGSQDGGRLQYLVPNTHSPVVGFPQVKMVRSQKSTSELRAWSKEKGKELTSCVDLKFWQNLCLP